jgi:type III pantothenate kinase
MILCLDVGNSHIFGGLFEGDQLKLTFRQSSTRSISSDELGLFLRGVLRENGFDPADVDDVALCSVVPELVYSISACSLKYFNAQPFVLKPGVKTGLKILYRNPQEVGSDRIAGAIAGTRLYPGQDLIIVDLGTATTVEAIKGGSEYLGGVILPGLKLSMQALDQGTARLGSVEIVKPTACLGQTTTSSIQSGLFYSHLGAIREICSNLRKEVFDGRMPPVLATGGFAALFSEEKLFDQMVPDLVLRGLLAAWALNRS